MFGRPKHFLEPELEAWHQKHYDLLADYLGGSNRLKTRPLITPTRQFFPATEAIGHDRVCHIFDHIKILTNMSGWPCQLEPQPLSSPAAFESPVFHGMKNHKAAGTFTVTHDVPVITYDPENVSDPIRLVAILVHELAHLRLRGWPELETTDELGRERLTDLATAVLGFGLFGAACSFNFKQFRGVMTQGWHVSRLGYLDEREWAYTLAMFCIKNDVDHKSVKPFCKDYFFSDMKQAVRGMEVQMCGH